MAITVRKAISSDAQAWVDLAKSCLSEDYPDKSVLSVDWATRQLDADSSQHETWVVDIDGNLAAAATFMGPTLPGFNPVANVGRNLFSPTSYETGAAEELVSKISELAENFGGVLVIRISASDKKQQQLFESNGYTCAGFQPFKHVIGVRESFMFYVRIHANLEGSRLPFSQSLPEVVEIASCVLPGLSYQKPDKINDGATGYPLNSSDITFQEVDAAEYKILRIQVQSDGPLMEFSGGYNQGAGFMRNDENLPIKSLLAMKGEQVVSGMSFVVDTHDRCVRVIDAFHVDDLSIGAIFSELLRQAESDYSAVYTEADILITAPRMLKTAEQLGFVPIAYLPAIFHKTVHRADVAKLIKLNMVYSLEDTENTTSAQQLIDIVDESFQDQKLGHAIINLLSELPSFEGLGDGELRKISRLFTRKLFQAKEYIFDRGDSGNEAYVIMRGAVDILLEEGTAPLATFGNGQIFGELAFLDGAARTAIAQANQPTILLVIQRSEFTDLVQREPHLGMVIMRNIAMELSNRLRLTNQALSKKK